MATQYLIFDFCGARMSRFDEIEIYVDRKKLLCTPILY